MPYEWHHFSLLGEGIISTDMSAIWIMGEKYEGAPSTDPRGPFRRDFRGSPEMKGATENKFRKRKKTYIVRELADRIRFLLKVTLISLPKNIGIFTWYNQPKLF